MLQTRSATLVFGDGVLRVVLNSRNHTIADARATLAAARQLVGEQRCVVLFDLRYAVTVTREARDFYANQVVGSFCDAEAILVESTLTQLLGRLFILTAPPTIPAQVFRDEAAAYDWLDANRVETIAGPTRGFMPLIPNLAS